MQQMTAILSCTPDDLYLFNLPFAIHSWNKMGVKCMVFMPVAPSPTQWEQGKQAAVDAAIFERSTGTTIYPFEAPPDKLATYAQCIRLYAAADPVISGREVLVTSDADMAVFNPEYWYKFEYNGAINIVGADLVPQGQVPMCYIAMPAAGWRDVMRIRHRYPQECVDDLLAGIEAENFRGNYWGKDQETAYHYIFASGLPIVCHNRAVGPGAQFATRRADRDGWAVTPNIIDAHLPRPGYTPENFEKIYQLFETMYPTDDHAWMREYREEYIKFVV
jgi:hypothetical protein